MFLQAQTVSERYTTHTCTWHYTHLNEIILRSSLAPVQPGWVRNSNNLSKQARRLGVIISTLGSSTAGTLQAVVVAQAQWNMAKGADSTALGLNVDLMASLVCCKQEHTLEKNIRVLGGALHEDLGLLEGA